MEGNISEIHRYKRIYLNRVSCHVKIGSFFFGQNKTNILKLQVVYSQLTF